MRGMRDHLEGKPTPHGDAFKVFVCRVGWGVIRCEKLLSSINDKLGAIIEGLSK